MLPMHHRAIQVSKGGNLSGGRCEKLHRPFLVQDPWLSSSMRMDEWEFPRADSLGAVPVTWKTQTGASYEGYSKRGTCTRCQHSPLSTSQLGGAGGLNTEADASTMWLSAAIGWMMLQNRRPCLRFNFLVNRSTMFVATFQLRRTKNPTSRMHESLALDPWLITCLMHRVGSSTTPLPVFLHCSPWHGVGWWTTCTVLRTARCIGAQHLVLVLGNLLQSRENLRRIKELLLSVCGQGLPDTIMLAWRNAIGQIAPGRVLDALRERFLQRGAPCGSRGLP